MTEETRKLVDGIIKGIQEKKGKDITVVDLEGLDGVICKAFVICEGGSPTQVEAVTDSIQEVMRKELHEKPTAVAGLENAQWVAIDYVDVIVHIFLPDVRDFYDLEHLWDDAPAELIPNLD